MRIADTREPWEAREKLLKLGWEQMALKEGDYAFSTVTDLTVGVERSTISDFSNIPERKDRFQRLVSAYDIPIAIIEGGMSRTSEDIILQVGVTWERIWNLLESFEDMGLRIQITTSLGHTVDRLNQLYTYYQDPVHKAPLPRKYSTDPRLLALSLIPGISRSTSSLLLQRYKTLRELANAPEEELLGIIGIGPRRAADIYAFFNK